MKLAVALSERAELVQKIKELSERLNRNAKIQEGDKPSEDPEKLLEELEDCAKRLEKLIARINLTNSATKIGKSTITEHMAKRDALKVKLGVYRNFLDAAADKLSRYSSKEIRILSTVDVASIQKKVDAYSKELRKLDEDLQEANWLTELL